MSELSDKAVEYFRSGYNCSQSVLMAFSGEMNIDVETAKNISSGFGAGMGRMQKTCGAVTGAYMVIGLYSGNSNKENKKLKEESYSLVKTFSKKFKARNGYTNCMKILNCDISTPDGRKRADEQKLFETICEKCVSDSVEIIEKILI